MITGKYRIIEEDVVFEPAVKDLAESIMISYIEKRDEINSRVLEKFSNGDLLDDLFNASEEQTAYRVLLVEEAKREGFESGPGYYQTPKGKITFKSLDSNLLLLPALGNDGLSVDSGIVEIEIF